MKKVIFTLFAAFFFLSQGMAQITLDQGDVSDPQMQYLRFNDTIPAVSIVPGNAGANQTWDLSTIHHHTTDTLIFTNPQWTPLGSSYPTSNLCMLTKNGTTFYSYMKSTVDSLVIIGQAGNFMGSPTPITAHLNPAQKIMQFPTTYQSTFDNTSKFQVIQYYGQQVGGIMIDSVKVRDRTFTSTNVDAWGSLTTPLGTYNCLRSLITQTQIDSVWAKSNSLGSWIDLTASYGVNETTMRYAWWAKNVGFVIAEVYVNPSTFAVESANYLGAQPQPGGINELALDGNTVVYPNPASDMISLTSHQVIKTVTIFNALGELVRSENLNSLNGNIGVSDIPKGVYFVRMNNSNDEVICIRKLVIE